MRNKSVVRQGDKASFVRGLPRSMAASEVVERAGKRGMLISKAYVHNIRSAANQKTRQLIESKLSPELVGKPRARCEKILKDLIRVLGPARIKSVLGQIEHGLAQHA